MAVTLFEKKQDCCGCGACANVCSQNAIAMVEDAYGFLYPQIDMAACIQCGACQKVCGYQDPPIKVKPTGCYAAAATEGDLLERSASGGVFAVLAKSLLNSGGVVYGAAMPLEGGRFTPKHIRINNLKELHLLQGSKYVQSDTGTTYSQAKEDLLSGKKVLYSGTPCQIAGLVKYLGKEYDNLLTMEVICHGVPSAKMFRDFIAVLERRYGGKITEFRFRYKKNGKSKYTAAELCEENGTKRQLVKNGYLLSYMHYFSKAYLFRSSCYNCPFATQARVADITVGDFWGFYQEHFDNDRFRDQTGISCMLVNTSRGRQAIADLGENLPRIGTEFEAIARHNEQLNKPSVCNKERDTILQMYRDSGYQAVDTHFRKTCKNEMLKQTLVDMIPQGIKRKIKRMIGRMG